MPTWTARSGAGHESSWREAGDRFAVMTDNHPLRSLRLPSIGHLRALEAAVRLGSFERASHELAITASAVSKRVSALESLLGVKLLSRVGRGVEPTPSGREYLEQVTVALGLLTRASYHRPRRELQRLRITTPPTFGRDVIVPRLSDFSALHPDIELEMMPSIPYVDIAAPGCDLEIRFGDGRFDELDCVRLIDESVFPVATPAYLAGIGGLRQPADLVRRAILLRCPLEPWEDWLRAAGLEPREPAGGHRFVDLGMLMASALNDQGVALARRTFAQQALRDGRLVRLFEVEASPRFAYYVGWPRRSTPGATQLRFIEWLQGVCRGLQSA